MINIYDYTTNSQHTGYYNHGSIISAKNVLNIYNNKVQYVQLHTTYLVLVMFTYVALQFVEKSVHYLKQATVSKCMYCGLPFNVFQCTCSVLGVPRDATEDDIRKQYRKLAVLIHPDKVLFEADLTC